MFPMSIVDCARYLEFLSKYVWVCVRFTARSTQETHWTYRRHVPINLVVYIDLYALACKKSLPWFVTDGSQYVRENSSDH